MAEYTAKNSGRTPSTIIGIITSSGNEPMARATQYRTRAVHPGPTSRSGPPRRSRLTHVITVGR
ncbi:hypothetical protein [Brevibacterium sp. FME37]|uniref:hypothetical protein n=1 Tax=Brevibacterium sp. FME37 TaxID=2742607 RepID=UPI0018672533|nr:hypothetical protein [Brevibacterium sp. FME37]